MKRIRIRNTASLSPEKVWQFVELPFACRDEEERKKEKEEAAKAELKKELDKYWKAVKVRLGSQDYYNSVLLQ